jgi:undecaprenyl-diphosphatase
VGITATAAAFYGAVALVVARRRSSRTCALLAGLAVWIAVAVACSRVLLGVHWLSDVVAGLAFGWAWFAVCAIAFGGRLLTFGAPVRNATRIAERNKT